MRIAFYAPLKAPTDPTPSGDRRMARLLIEALRRSGHEIDLACRFRSRDGAGDAARQARLRDIGARLAERLIGRYRGRPAVERPALWLTYHLYYKAPDWLGPTVAAALDIPYVVAEASVAGKRASGPWDEGHRAVIAGLRCARLVIGLNGADRAGVLPWLASPDRLVALAPFIDRTPFAAAAGRRALHRDHLARRHAVPGDQPWLLAVGMMRHGAKLASYRLLADALRALTDRPWTLILVGDGPARALVARAFEGIADRVHLVGQQTETEIAAWCAAADLLVWPAIDEAFGMALVEAQAAGLPVVAGASGGVPEVVRDGVTGLTPPPSDVSAFATAVRRLLAAPEQRRAFGVSAARVSVAEHDVVGAAARLDAMLARL